MDIFKKMNQRTTTDFSVFKPRKVNQAQTTEPPKKAEEPIPFPKEPEKKDIMKPESVEKVAEEPTTEPAEELNPILDEPTAGLDPNERIRFRNLISELSEERLVLLSTHIVSDIEYIANQIWLMKDGKLVRSGTSDELIRTMPVDVWKCFVRKSAVSSMAEKYKISNMKAESDGVELRIISKEKPVPEAKCVEASLEDVFLYYFGEKAGDKNAEF